jgi:hypothetical protein
MMLNVLSAEIEACNGDKIYLFFVYHGPPKEKKEKYHTSLAAGLYKAAAYPDTPITWEDIKTLVKSTKGDNLAVKLGAKEVQLLEVDAGKNLLEAAVKRMVSIFSGESDGKQLFSGVSEIWEARYRILSIGKLTHDANTTTTYAAEFRDQVTVHDIMGTTQADAKVKETLNKVQAAIEDFDKTGNTGLFTEVEGSIFVSSVPSDAQCTYWSSSIGSIADILGIFRSQL